MGGPEKPTISPEQVALQKRAQDERIDSIRDRVSDDTRDLLIRFGRRALFNGSSGSASPSSNLPGSIGLFHGRQLQALRATGRL